MVSRSVQGIRSVASKKNKGHKATPSHVPKGAQKSRSTSKGEMREDTRNYINSLYEAQSKVRLCFVKVKRTRLPNCLKNGATLQDQPEYDIVPHTVRNISVTTNILKSAAERKYVINQHIDADTKPNGNNSIYKSPVPVKNCVLKTQTPAPATKKCVVRLIRISRASQKDLYVRNAAKDALLSSQIISPSLDHEKRNAFRKLSLTMHHKSMNNDTDLSKQTCAQTMKNSEEASTKQMQPVCKPHIDNTLSSTNEMQRRRSFRLLELAKSSKTVQETTDIESHCDKENKAPSESNENQKNGTICRHSFKKQNAKSFHNAQLCKSNELKQTQSLDSRDVVSKSNSKRLKEKVTQNKYENQIKSKNQQDIKIPICPSKTATKENKGDNGDVQPINGSMLSCSVTDPVVNIKNLIQFNERNKNVSLSSMDPIKTQKRSESHCDKDRHFRHPCRNNDYAVTSMQAASTISNNQGSETAYISGFHPQRNSTMQFESHLPLKFTNPIEKRFKKVAGSQINCDAEVSSTTSYFTTPDLTTGANKTNKFFHRQDANTATSMYRTVTTQMPCTDGKNSRLLPKRSSQVRREQVYDFLSQSQTSDTDGTVSGRKKNKSADPSADIIQKLIAEGKAVVATCVKGRSVMKRINIKKPKKVIVNRKRAKKKSGKAGYVQKSSNKPPKIIKPIAEEDDDQFADDQFMDNDYESVFLGKEINTKKHLSEVRTYKSHSRKTEQEGTFSNLAKSVLLQQAGRTDVEVVNANRLLSMAKKLISTPKNKNIPTIRTTINADLSPILSMVPKQRLDNNTNATPWRVDEDDHLPRVFNFSRSSGNLPSFSSDFIPPTPRKDKSKITEGEEKHVQFEEPSLPEVDGVSIPNQRSTPLEHNGINSSIPSFSSNDSNAENKSPETDGQTNCESASMFNIKQLSNPRRALSYRSPLKAINITEVVTLPSLDMSKILRNEKHLQHTRISEFKELSESLNSANKSKEELFGFEEFLSQNDRSTQEEESQTSDSLDTSPIEVINEKRLLLRKLKPSNSEVNNSLHKEVAETQTNINKQLFNDKKVSRPQRTVKEMLCSTMLIEKSTTTTKPQGELLNNANYRTGDETNSSGMLFKDFEPESTFNEEDPHRTYIRPYKRHRRLNENGLIFALESGESDADEDYSTRKKKPSRIQNHETGTSSGKQADKRRKKGQQKDKPELVHFVQDFNEMCKEVENYKLVVEKSV